MKKISKHDYASIADAFRRAMIYAVDVERALIGANAHEALGPNSYREITSKVIELRELLVRKQKDIAAGLE